MIVFLFMIKSEKRIVEYFPNLHSRTIGLIGTISAIIIGICESGLI